MPAKITVRAELASLLAKSQELTDANRQAQLKKEADRREDQKRLKAKKANEDAARRKPLEDPVGRNIFTAAAGGGPLQLGQFWWESPDIENNWTITVWSSDGSASASAAVDPALIPPGYGFPDEVLEGTEAEDIPIETFEELFGINTISSGTGFRFVNRSIDVHAPLFTFPVNAETAVIVYTWDYAVYWYAAAVGYPTGSPIEGGDTYRFFPSSPPVGFPFDRIGGVVYGTLGGVIGNRYAFGGAFFVRGEKAFVVSESSAREISVPASIFGRPPRWVNGTNYILPSTLGPYSLWPFDILTAYPGFVDNPDHYTYGGANVLSSLGTYALRNAPSDTIDGINPKVRFGQIWTPQASATFNNPVLVNTTLTFAEQRAMVPWFNVRETAFFRRTDNFSTSDPEIVSAAGVALQLSDVDFDSANISIYPAATPIAIPTVIPIADPRWKRRRVKISRGVSQKPTNGTPDGLIQEVLFWDWGKPAYCRAQLLEMGFTEADLIPTPPPP